MVQKYPKLLLLILLIIGVFGLFIILYSTPYGMGLVNDSSAYINGARNLLAGDGYSRTAGNGAAVPLTHFPPFLSMVLASFGRFGIDALQAIRIVNSVLFGINIMLVGIVVYAMTKSTFFSILGAALFLLSETIISIHTFALSEPLFIFLFFISILLIHSHLVFPKFVKIIILGIITGLIYLTRYIGVSVFGALFIIFLMQDINAKGKIKNLLFYLLTSAILPLIWSIRNALLTGNFANRTIYYHPISEHKWFEGIANFWDWIFPGNFNLYGRSPKLFMWLLIIIIFSILYLGVIHVWQYIKMNKKNQDQLIFIGIIAELFIYLAVLIFSMTFVDPVTIFENRMIAPLYLCLIIISMVILNKIWQKGNRCHKTLVTIIVVVFLLSFGRDSYILVNNLHNDGQGFASSWWHNPEMINDIKSLEDKIIYSNRITALYLITERPAFTLPSPEEIRDIDKSSNTDQQLNQIRSNVIDGDAVILMFGYGSYIKDPSYQDWVMQITDGLPVYSEYDNITLFGQQE